MSTSLYENKKFEKKYEKKSHEYYNIIEVLRAISKFHYSRNRKVSYRYLLLLSAINSIFELRVEESINRESLIPSMIEMATFKGEEAANQFYFPKKESLIEGNARRLQTYFGDVEILKNDIEDFNGKI